MEKKIKIGALLLIGIIIIVLSYWFIPIPINIENINDCVLDSDCAIVARGICGDALAINKDDFDSWNKNLEKKRLVSWGVICAPTLSIDYFDAKCIDNKCTPQINPLKIEESKNREINK